MMPADSQKQAADELFAYVQDLAGKGRAAQAQSLCEQLLAAHPEHSDALNFLGIHSLQRGEAERAGGFFERALAVEPANPTLLLNLALARAAQGRLDDAVATLDRALAVQPDFALALLHKGNILERAGQPREAIQAYYFALEAAGAQELWSRPQAAPPAVRTLLARATATVQTARADFIVERLRAVRARYGEAALGRVQKCLDMHLGRRPVEYPDPDQRPTFLPFPDIPARNFFTREEFPELRNLEAATPVIQAELAAVLGGTEGFRPFIDMPAGPAADYWRVLNRSPDWNAFFFYRDGVRNEENCRRCPRTAAALDALDLNRVPGHSPESIFSVLTPGTHIPPHTGVTNSRLVCHLPLVIPENCAIRVGGEERGWTEGECLIFDDTFEHEAWNHSDRTRVVLICDLWNPYLTAAEREAVSVLVQATGHFNRQMIPPG